MTVSATVSPVPSAATTETKTGEVAKAEPAKVEPAKVEPAPSVTAEPAPKPSRGRPRLGVVAREVTLLPRHWDWLASQPGGASAALRRLVDEARRHDAGPDARRRTQEAAYRVMTALAGDRPGYEEATRALFANDLDRFNQLTAAWPPDVGAYIRELNATVTPSP